MFLTARLFMYRQVYFHRTVRAIDLDLSEVFGPSIVAIFGDRSPVDALSAYADLDEYALLHQAALWARGEVIADDPSPGDGHVTEAVAAGWRAILLRQPRWRAEAEIRLAYEDTPPADQLATPSCGRSTNPAAIRPRSSIRSDPPSRVGSRSTWRSSMRGRRTRRRPTRCWPSKARTAGSPHRCRGPWPACRPTR